MKKNEVMGFKAWILNYEKKVVEENGFVHPSVECFCEKVRSDKKMPSSFGCKKELVEYLVSRGAEVGMVAFAKVVFSWYEGYCRREAVRAPNNPWVD